MRELRAREGARCELAMWKHIRARCVSTRGREVWACVGEMCEGVMCELVSWEHPRSLGRELRAPKHAMCEHAKA